jgi:hypothetical protein
MGVIVDALGLRIIIGNLLVDAQPQHIEKEMRQNGFGIESRSGAGGHER